MFELTPAGNDIQVNPEWMEHNLIDDDDQCVDLLENSLLTHVRLMFIEHPPFVRFSIYGTSHKIGKLDNPFNRENKELLERSVATSEFAAQTTTLLQLEKHKSHVNASLFSSLKRGVLLYRGNRLIC